MATDPKQIQHDAVHRQEPLRVRSRGEPPHLSLALAGRLVRHFRSIVLVLSRAMHHGRHDRAVRRRVAAQLVRDQPARGMPFAFQQCSKELDGRPAVAPRLDEDVDDVAVLVHRPPQILPLPLIVTKSSSRYHVSPKRPRRRRSLRA